MAFSFSPKIVTDGLVLYLDAANQSSYVSGSTSWNDISRGGNNGTLNNGPTFNSANGGSIVFDGTNDYINTNYQIPSTSTIEIVINPNSNNISTVAGFLDGWSSGNVTGILMRRNGANLSSIIIGNGTTTTTLNLSTPDNSYSFITIVNSGSGYILYLNGALQSSGSFIYLPANNLRVGARLSNSTSYWMGMISTLKIYNRVLSANEVLQNYNATKTRFGL